MYAVGSCGSCYGDEWMADDLYALNWCFLSYLSTFLYSGICTQGFTSAHQRSVEFTQ